MQIGRRRRIDEPEAIGVITAVCINVFPVSDANIGPVSTFIQIESKEILAIISNFKRNSILQLKRPPEASNFPPIRPAPFQSVCK